MSWSHRQTWQLLSKATHFEVLCQVPIAWVLMKCGQTATHEMDTLPAVDFVFCDHDTSPLMAIQLVNDASTGQAMSLADKSQIKLLIGLLNQTTLRTLVWTNAPPTQDELVRALMAATDWAEGDGKFPLPDPRHAQATARWHGAGIGLGERLLRGWRSRRFAGPSQPELAPFAWISAADGLRVCAALRSVLKAWPSDLPGRRRVQWLYHLVKQRGIDALAEVSTPRRAALMASLLGANVPDGVKGDVARLTLHLQHLGQVASPPEPRRPSWAATQIAPMDVREVDMGEFMQALSG